MKALNVFISLLLIFIILLFIISMISIFYSNTFNDFMLQKPKTNQLISFCIKHVIQIHSHFIMFSLVLSFILYFSFTDISLFKSKNYILAIMALPILFSLLLYYYQYQVLPSFLKSSTYGILKDNNMMSLHKILIPVSTYGLAFAVFIVVPLCILFNNKNWYLQTMLLLSLILPVLFRLNKLYEQFILNIFHSLHLFRDPLKPNEGILILSYILFGYFLFKFIGPLKKLKSRIDLGQVRKIHH